MDYATSKGKFVRLCVEVDLSKPFMPKFFLKNRVRQIQY